MNGTVAVILHYSTKFIWEPITSKWLKLDAQCLDKKMQFKTSSFQQYMIMVIFAEVTENECINERHSSKRW